MDEIDLSKAELPSTQIADREFDQRFIGNAIQYLKDIRDNSNDYVANVQKIEIKQNDDNWDLWLDGPDGLKVFKPTKWAKSQTIGVTELPKRYHDTLFEKGHGDKAVEHMNMWLHDEQEKKFQVRTVGNNYRALVSPGYNAFDNFDLFQTTAGAVKAANLMRSHDTKPVQFYKAQVSEQNLYVHLIDEGREWDLGNKDTYKPMIVIKNSEVGDGAMRVEAGLWRYMCANLQLHGVISKQIHLGERLSEGIWSPDTKQAQNVLWRNVVRDSINAGIADDRLFEGIISSIRESKEIKVDPIPTVEKIKKANKLSDTETDAIIKAMMGDTTVAPNEKDTLFQVVQGVTQAAKTLGIERGNDLSRIAGDMKALIKVVA